MAASVRRSIHKYRRRELRSTVLCGMSANSTLSLWGQYFTPSEGFDTYVVDPADVGADPGEDGGLLIVVAAHAGAEAHHAVHVPGAVAVLAVQGTSRVSLRNKRERNVHEAAAQAPRMFVKRKEKVLTLQLASLPSPPAQTMLLVTRLPHQSYLLQVSWLTTGRRACCRMSAIGPPA